MRNFLRAILLVASLFLSDSGAGDELTLPEIGDPTGALFTPDQEHELGEAFYRSLHGQVEISDDPELTDYIDALGHKLAAHSDMPQHGFHFFFVMAPDINAFAGPGGYIGINSGLVIASDSESELASVLAHEIAHITQRHLYQTFDAARKMTLPNAALLLGAILIGTQSPQAGQAALIAAQAGMAQMQINFTRDNEQEADRVGMQTLSRSEFDPRAMPAFFERLQQSTRYVGRNVPEFLRTHPVTTSRIADTRARSEGFPYRQVPDSLAYLMIRARLRAEAPGAFGDKLAYFRALEGQGIDLQREVARYGLALTNLAQNRTDEARTLLEPLVTRYPDVPQFANALARVERSARRFERSLEIYRNLFARFPSHRFIRMEVSRAHLAAGHPDVARKLLVQEIVTDPTRPELHRLLAEAYTRSGHVVEGHRSMAEYYYLSGQTRQAITQLRIAEKAARGNFYLLSMVDERLRQLEVEELERRKKKSLLP